MSNKNTIFKNASVTFYTASLFFPRKVKEDVFSLYAFVRTADDFTDTVPQNKKAFLDFKKETFNALKSGKSKNPIIQDFVELAKKKQFEISWILAFFTSLEMDLTVKNYETYSELKKYIYGSAEVIGLFMAKILSLPENSFPYAQKLGESMQFINMLRDITEDISLGRIYLPKSEQEKFHIQTLSVYNKDVKKFIQFELKRFSQLQYEAEIGYKYIPKRYRIPIKTAGDMYKWTGEQIKKNPSVIWDRKVKPKKWFVILTILKNIFIA